MNGNDFTGWYTTKFVASAFDAQTNFATGSLTFSILASGTNDILLDTAATISAATSQAVGSGSYTNQSYTYTLSSSTTTDTLLCKKNITM